MFLISTVGIFIVSSFILFAILMATSIEHGSLKERLNSISAQTFKKAIIRITIMSCFWGVIAVLLFQK